LKIQKLLLLTEKERRQCKASFYQFFTHSWSSIWPTEFKNNWHFKYLCDTIQTYALRVINNEPRTKDLVINVPPGTAKSTIISIALNAWVWIHKPSIKFITTSYSPTLAEEHAKRTRKLIESQWYQSLYGNLYTLLGKADSYFETSKGGSRRTTSPGSQLATGFHADFLIFDDPDSAKGVFSDAIRNETIQWFDETMPSRMVNPATTLKIVVQQRLHVEDITGHIKKNYADVYDFIVLPGILTENVFPKHLAQFYKNNLLFPARITQEVIENYRKTLRNSFAGQILMTPLSIGGNYFKESWPHFFTQDQLPQLEQIAISVDTSSSDKVTACPTSIQVWAYKRPNYYLLYDYTEILSPLHQETAIRRIARQYPGCRLVIENTASGFFLIEKLGLEFSVYPFNPSKFGGKEARADMIVYLWENGNVYLYDTQYTHNIYLPEILIFPNQERKDRVDAMAQGLIYFTRCATQFAVQSN